jgi:peptidoglycan/xylan/chitin deacetylase (PgdA/CDA1 family)
LTLLSTTGVRRHLRETVRVWLGLRPGEGVPDLPDALARLLLRTEEREEPHRDQWDCWEFAFSDNFRRGALWRPEVDEWVAERRRELESRTALEPLWPDGRGFAMCLTHDVDIVSRRQSPTQAARAAKAAIRRQPGEPNTTPHRALRVARAAARSAYFGIARVPATAETLQRCVEEEQAHGVTASYFFTVHPSRPTQYDCVYRMTDRCEFRGARVSVASVARQLSAEGFDVGLHGSYMSAFDSDVLAEEKAMLEEAIDRPVLTTRQHYLRYDVARTPLVQDRAGLLADATLGFNRNVGFRAGTSLPFHPYDADAGVALDLLEIPLVAMDVALVRPNSLELNARLAKQVMRQLVDAVAAVGGVATFLFHPHMLLDRNVLHLYRSCIEYGLDRGAWIASLAEIDQWWRARERRLDLAAAVPAGASRTRA